MCRYHWDILENPELVSEYFLGRCTSHQQHEFDRENVTIIMRNIITIENDVCIDETNAFLDVRAINHNIMLNSTI